MSTNKSYPPRTDAYKFSARHQPNAPWVYADDCETLERELTAAQQQIRELQADRERLRAVMMMANHCIPHYAYGDNEAACDMAHRLDWICKELEVLAARQQPEDKA